MSEVINIPDGWVETTLGEVVERITKGTTPKTFSSNNDDINYIKSDALNYGGFLESNKFVKITNKVNEELKRSQLKVDDILLSMAGEYLGKTGLVKEEHLPANTNQAVAIITVDKNIIDHIFLWYKLRDINTVKYFKSIPSQSAQPNINFQEIRTLSIYLPQISEQKSIASILTSFDYKIEFLQAQNKTLEATAQTIFTEWFGKYSFGDELPDGWKVGQIGDLIEIKRGSSPRPIQDYISDSGCRWLKISDATATVSPYIFEIKEHIKIEGLKHTTLKKAGDLVLSNSATPGMPKILAIDTCVHDGWMHFPSSKVSNEYLYLLFLSIRPALVQQGSGSVFTNLKTDILRKFYVVIPTKDYYDEFDVLIKPIFNKIYNNAIQIQTLTKTRDELLPRLMSGEVKTKI